MLALVFAVSVLVPDVPATARIDGVTVYGDTALVSRIASLPGPGRYVISGLPAAADPGSVRVTLGEGHVVAVEVLERLSQEVTDARLAELKGRQLALERQIRETQDGRQVAIDLQFHLKALLVQEEQAHAREVAEGRPSAETWAANLEFLAKALQQNKDRVRELDWKLVELEDQKSALAKELGDAQGRQVIVRDVIVEVATTEPTEMGLEYLVWGAGWRPLYELRAAADARQVELVYRAEVWQRTGEDWGEVTLALSTAQPQRGAQGPEAMPQWLRIYDKPHLTGRGREAPATAISAEMAKQLEELGYTNGDDAPAPPPFASVSAQGLSVQYVLPRRESVASREQTSNVLVGQQALPLRPEYAVVPALDTHVWLSGRTLNDTPWTLLPGRTAVYFGRDFIGNGSIDEALPPGAELVLHLGADDGFKVERTRTQDLHEEPGIWSDRQAQRESWRITVENRGALVTEADGSATVFVREALPRPTDERIEVEIVSMRPSPSGDERWKKDLEDKGIRTLVLRVPRGGTAEVVYELALRWPGDLMLSREGG